jgi:cell volume regulation protein A
MGLNIKKVLSSSRKALLLAVLGFVFSVLGVCAFTVVAFGVPLIYGLLFGSIFGGSSSIVVISLTSKIKLSDQGCTILILESAITDILCVVISLSILDVILTGEANIVAIGLGITGKILIGLIVGLIAGFVWLFALKKVLNMPFYYMLTLGIVMLSYAVSESIGGSGALSALVFGLILGNERDIVKLISYLKPDEEKVTLSVSKGLKRFEAEIAFLIRTFFFVFLGIIFSFSTLYIFIMGILLSALLFVTRFGAVWITTAKSHLKKERPIMTFVLTRGLAAAVLATLPTQYGLLYADLFINVAVVVIVSTAVLATVGVFALGRKKEPSSNHRVPDDEDEIEENDNGD